MKRQLTDFFKIIRWKNVVIFLILQIYLYFILIKKSFDITDGWLFLVLSMLFFGIAGNIQNNILDYDIDRQKPDFTGFNKTAYLTILIISEILGMIFGFTGFYMTFSPTLLYAILAIPILISLYNYYLKKWPLIGNLLIALTTALAIIIPVYYAKNLEINPVYINFLLTMAFALTFLRELIKDMEDVQYDASANYKTLPVLNMKFSKNLLVVLSLITWLILFSFKPYFTSNNFIILLIISGLLLSFSLIEVFKNEFKTATRLLKCLMLCGILSLVFL